RRSGVLGVRVPPRLPGDQPIQVSPLVTPPHLLQDLTSHLLHRPIRGTRDTPVTHQLPIIGRLLDEPVTGRPHDARTQLARELAARQLPGVLTDDVLDLLLRGTLIRRLQITISRHARPVEERVRNPRIPIPRPRGATGRATRHGAVRPVHVVEVHTPDSAPVHVVTAILDLPTVQRGVDDLVRPAVVPDEPFRDLPHHGRVHLVAAREVHSHAT